MKILQINSVFKRGSTGRIADDIHQLLLEHGHDSKVAYGRYPVEDTLNTIKIGNKLDNYKHVLKTRVFDLHGFGSKKETEIFIDKVRAYDPDIIHLHNIHGYYLNIEVLFDYLKEVQKPVIWTFHDCWAFTGHCAYFEYAGCNCWKGEKCIQKTTYPQSLLFNNSIQNYQNKKEIFTGLKKLTIVTPSKWLKDLVKESFLKDYSVEVINNGINLEVFKPIESNFRSNHNFENKTILLGVANLWDERKGLVYFLELAKKLPNNYQIVLVGLSDKQIKDLPSNILGIKNTTSVEALAEIYGASDIFVNPTLEDNFPTTNLEALACGTPVITFDTGGSPESIDEKSGIVVDQGDTAKLYQSIINFDFDTFTSNNARKRAELFSKENMLNSYLKIYPI